MRTTEITKGLGYAGALLLSGCANSDPAYHDTYYVVFTGPATTWFIAILLATPIMWMLIARLSPGQYLRTRAAAIAAWLFSLAGILGPVYLIHSVNQPDIIWLFNIANQIASFSATVLGCVTIFSLGLALFCLYRRVTTHR